MNPNPPTSQRGVTLIELIMAVAMLSVLLALSVPAFADLTMATQTRTTKSLFLLALSQARSAAVTNQNDAVFCPSANQRSCDDTLDWHSGWIVFIDNDRNGVRGNEEKLISAGQTVASGIGIASTLGRRHVTYRPDGSATGTNVSFTFCDRRGPAKASSIVVNNGGRARQGAPTPAQAGIACEIAKTR